MKTLVSLIPDGQHVAQAQETLEVAGVGADGISKLVRPAEVWERFGGSKKMTVVYKYAGAGAVIGLVVGGLYGLPAGIMNCAEMGCPQTTSAGLLALITVYWVLGGAFLGAIAGTDRLEQNLYSYVQGVRRGGVLLVVETPDEQASEIERILRSENGLLVHSLGRGRQVDG